MLNNKLPPLYPHLKSKNETLSLIHGIYAGILSCALAVVFYLEYQQQTMSMVEISVLCAGIGLFIALNIVACLKVKKGANQGLILSRILAVLMLLSFPIGTLLGAFALWKSLKSQWEV
ncbi:hypothetical protein D9K79_17015 [Acinetobacter cumulans]|uniref:DUF4064 domain-containing protein n=1 Tax=Acinetobacter cumulans TaxID=2136182 RepID=A0ABX9U1L1_9GAMM|nr:MULTISPECIES: hypothetical protein [Acinetobacter]NWK74819.1 hypothetical protein [Acinetobacter sp. SwsAc6]RKG47760.1 hypothetical protein D7V68_10265 [Acinetobacter cumulans]RLL37515.1 hypothetical protein D9K79_17015 [Acinetobacter cumulans]